MSTQGIPDDIRRYLLQCVPSVPYIEAVLLMRENLLIGWQPAQLAGRLYLNIDDAGNLLAKLQADGIVAPWNDVTVGFRYAPDSAELASVWDRLAVVYAHHLIEVSTLVHTKSASKARMLADAFVWKKER